MIKDIYDKKNLSELDTNEIRDLIFCLYDELDLRLEDLPILEYLDKIYDDSEIKQIVVQCLIELMNRGHSYMSLIEHIRYTLR